MVTGTQVYARYAMATKASVATGATPQTEASFRPGAAVRLLAVVPDAGSPLKAPWPEVMQHLRQRMEWFNGDFDLVSVTEAQLAAEGGDALLQVLAAEAQAVVALQVRQPPAVAALQAVASGSGRPAGQVLLALDSDSALQQWSSLGGYSPAQGLGLLGKIAPWAVPVLQPAVQRGTKVYDTVQELYSRHNSDDLLYIFLVLVNAYVVSVPEVANSIDDTGLSTLSCMLLNCGPQIVSCVRDDGCAKALNCLQECKFNDQVCSYRCIASYESPLLEAFSLCILQKHNCLGLNAQPPALPDPAPMSQFRGLPLTHEAAEDLFIGYFADHPFSWRVAAGKNPAYDYFPCQFQLFYRGKARGSMWYDPIFKVKTLDDKEVWRERHYRVRRAQVPGTFHLSVLDNGVTSKEYWRVLDCDDALQWCLFYYSGAASVAGVSYSGAILATFDGGYPEASEMPRVAAALDRAGIKTWELSTVDNSACQDAPLRPIAEPVWAVA